VKIKGWVKMHLVARDSGAGTTGASSTTAGGWAGTCALVAECSANGRGALSAAAASSAGAARFLVLRGVGGSSKTAVDGSEIMQQRKSGRVCNAFDDVSALSDARLVGEGAKEVGEEGVRVKKRNVC
jgi:hypothetical protein